MSRREMRRATSGAPVALGLTGVFGRLAARRAADRSSSSPPKKHFHAFRAGWSGSACAPPMEAYRRLCQSLDRMSAGEQGA